MISHSRSGSPGNNSGACRLRVKLQSLSLHVVLGTGRPAKRCQSLGSRLHNTQHFLTPVAKEDVHGYQHASYHYSSRSAARRRRLVRSWTLVLSDAFMALMFLRSWSPETITALRGS